MKASYSIRTLDGKHSQDGFVEELEPDADILMHLVWNNGRMFVHEAFVKFMFEHGEVTYKVRLMLDDEVIFDIDHTVWKNLPELMNKLHLDDVVFLTMRGMTIQELIDYKNSEVFSIVSTYVNSLK